jgi:hypothetical protein
MARSGIAKHFGSRQTCKLEIGKAKRREFSSRTQTVRDGAEVSLRRPTGSSRKSIRDGEERTGAKREGKASACSVRNDGWWVGSAEAERIRAGRTEVRPYTIENTESRIEEGGPSVEGALGG